VLLAEGQALRDEPGAVVIVVVAAGTVDVVEEGSSSVVVVEGSDVDDGSVELQTFVSKSCLVSLSHVAAISIS
jgi:hypothetical protein